MKVKFFQQIKVACGRTGAIKEIKHAPHPLNIHTDAPQHDDDDDDDSKTNGSQFNPVQVGTSDKMIATNMSNLYSSWHG